MSDTTEATETELEAADRRDRAAFAAVCGTGGYRGVVKFFEPTRDFLAWAAVDLKGVTVYDVGAGAGHVARALAQHQIDVVALDLAPHDAPEWPVEIADGAVYPYAPGSVVMLCRPCHGMFPLDTIRQARDRGAAEVLYVGKAANLGRDMEEFFGEAKHVLARAGEDDEDVFRIVFGPRGTSATYTYALVAMANDHRWYRDVGDAWIHSNGERYEKASSDCVMETVEAAAWTDLDWTKTSIYRRHSAFGWVSPAGTFTGCGPFGHDDVARFVLKMPVVEVERTHVRISQLGHHTGPTNGRMTAAQKEWLTRHGHDIDEDGDEDGYF